MKPSEFIGWLQKFIDGKKTLSDDDAGEIRKHLDQTDMTGSSLAARFAAAADSDIRALEKTRNPKKKLLADIVCLRLKRSLDDALHAAAPIDRNRIGEMIEGEGIFLGTWEPKDKDGKNLGRIFNIFAAPQDLTDAKGKEATRSFVDTVDRLSNLKNWHGHDGSSLAKEPDILVALSEDRYNGEWIVPPLEILVGKDRTGTKNQPDNLYTHMDKGALKGTVTTNIGTSTSSKYWYWSSTPDPVAERNIADVRMDSGQFYWNHEDQSLSSCRPVRLTEVLPRFAAPALS